MKFREYHGDILSAPYDYMIVHCISGDMALGAGVAKQLDTYFNCKKQLHHLADLEGRTVLPVGRCYVTDHIANLVTKERYYQKPTMSTLTEALNDLSVYVHDHRIKKIAMPKIGCGLDRLDWAQVSRTIKDVFCNDDIEIVVYFW